METDQKKFGHVSLVDNNLKTEVLFPHDQRTLPLNGKLFLSIPIPDCQNEFSEFQLVFAVPNDDHLKKLRGKSSIPTEMKNESRNFSRKFITQRRSNTLKKRGKAL